MGRLGRYSDPGAPRDWFRTREREAVRLLGLADGQYDRYGWSCWDGINHLVEANTGSGNVDIHDETGVVLLSSGATENSFAQLLWGDSATDEALRVATGNGKKWLIGWRFKLGTLNTDSQVEFGLYGPDGTTYCYMGFNGAVTASNFALRGSTGSAIDSGVAKDTAVHDMIAYNDGSLTHLLIDGVEYGTPANTYLNQSTGAALYAVAHNAAGDAVDRNVQVERVWAVFGGNRLT